MATPPSFLLTPEGAALPTSNFPQLKKYDGSNYSGYTLGFDTTTGESAFWKFKIPTTASFSAAAVKIVSKQLAATSGTVGWIVTCLNRVDNDPVDASGAADTVTAANVKGTAGKLLFQTASLTVSGWAAGDVIEIKLTRDVANDNVAEDAEFMLAVLELS